MTMELLAKVSIRQLRNDEAVPYNLLLDADPSKELVDKYLANAAIYIAQLENKVIGTYVLFELHYDTVEIKNIAVEDDYQGKGIGKLMLHDAFERAKQKGYKKVIIGTANTSIGQLYLYQKVGFEITDIKKNFFIDNYSEPLFENGLRVKHMIVLMKQL
jgi:ribosomal protein S18 acetylase RimI-like enzyme